MIAHVRGTEGSTVGGNGPRLRPRGAPSKPYPLAKAFQGFDIRTVARPRGLSIAGDLTDNLRWDAYEAVFPTAGLATPAGPLAVFACLGNHDGDAAGATRQGFIALPRLPATGERP